MTTLVDRIAEVLRKHKVTTRRIKHPWRKGILLNISACTGCDWGDEEATEDDHAAHVAERIAEAIQLTEETYTYEATEVKGVMGGEGNMRYGGQTIRSLGWRAKRRWVSPWTAIDGIGEAP